MGKTGSWLLDVDVDYMQEMQNECYTRIINPGPGVLQSMSRWSIHPEVEARDDHDLGGQGRGDPGPEERLLGFHRGAEGGGYQVEERGVYANDAEVVRAISVCKEFYRTVSRRLMLEHMDAMMRGDMEGFQKAEAVAAKGFFKRKAYG